MDLGSLPDWLGAIGGLLAVIAAFTAWNVSSEMLRLERTRDDKTERAAHSAQAELFFVLGARLPERPADEAWSIFLVNTSSKPIFDLTIASSRADGSVANKPLKLGALPPGTFVVPSDPKYHWGSLIDYSRMEEKVDLLLKGNGYKMINWVEFADAARTRWVLRNGTILEEGLQG